jgi:prepilin peptidase CpaA
MALFAMRAIGGGDAKFYAALAAWFPLSMGLYYLFYVSLAGLALLVVWFLARKFMLRTLPDLKPDSPFRKLPYGVAIGAGATIGHLAALTAQ